MPTHYQAEQTFIRDLPVSDPAPELTARRCFAESQAVDRNSSATSSCRPGPLKREVGVKGSDPGKEKAVVESRIIVK